MYDNQRPLMYDLIVRRYKQYGSMKAVAKELRVSHNTVKKVLITEGLFSCEVSDNVRHLAEQGLTEARIAEELGISRSSVNANIPYSKGTYLTAHKSVNAQRIKACRERKKKEK